MGEIRGVRMRVVVALDDPDPIVTIQKETLMRADYDSDHLSLLGAAAQRYGLDEIALLSAAQAALAAPDRVIRLDVLARAAA